MTKTDVVVVKKFFIVTLSKEDFLKSFLCDLCDLCGELAVIQKKAVNVVSLW